MEPAAEVGGGRSQSLSQLTPREAEVLREAAVGRTNRQVAEHLGVTVHAVKFHLASIFRKLEVQNRTEAAVLLLRFDQARVTDD